PRTAAEVVDAVLAGLGGPQREQVGLREIGDVDVVADARTVRGRVVVAEQLQLLPPAGGDLERDRYQVGLRVVPFAVRPVRADHVEVAQRHDREVDGELGRPVRAGRRGRGGLGDGDLGRIAVDGRGRGEHQAAYAGLPY